MNFRTIASGSTGNQYVCECDGHAPLLIEAGAPWKEISAALGGKATSAAGVLLSHQHQDHARSVLDAAKLGLPVYCSPGTFAALKVPKEQRGAFRNVLGGVIEVGAWRVRAFAVDHDASEAIGFFVQAPDGDRLVYVTDSGGCNISFPGLTHVAVECNHDGALLAQRQDLPEAVRERIGASHMSLAACLQFLGLQDVARVREVWLLHMSDGNSDAERFRAEVQAKTGRPTFIAEGKRPPAPLKESQDYEVHAELWNVESKKKATGESYLKLSIGADGVPYYADDPKMLGYLVAAAPARAKVKLRYRTRQRGDSAPQRIVMEILEIGAQRFEHGAPVETEPPARAEDDTPFFGDEEPMWEEGRE